jgi:hypothetical protein
MHEVVKFAWAVLTNWAGYVTSGLIAALLVGYSYWKNKPMPKFFLIMFAVLFLFMAFFKAWEDQRKIAAALRQTTDDLIGTQFKLTILRAIVGGGPEFARAALVVKISNLGASSAADANSWALDVLTDAGQVTHGVPMMLRPGNNDWPLTGTGMMNRFVEDDALDVKAAKVIARNGYEVGVLQFVFPGLPQPFTVDSTRLRLRVEDMRGNGFTTETTIAELRRHSSEYTFLPLRYPVPLPIGDTPK